VDAYLFPLQKRTSPRRDARLESISQLFSTSEADYAKKCSRRNKDGPLIDASAVKASSG
jgi:hypothetical protein